jgi:hypothetical protein
MMLKVKIDNDSKLIQQQLFDLGFLWDGEYLPSIRKIESQYLCIDTVSNRIKELSDDYPCNELEKPLLWSIEGIVINE